MTLQANILGVSVWGPGLDGWPAGRLRLAGASSYVDAAPCPPPPPLPPAERRRCGPVTRLALAAAHEAALAAGLPLASLRTVFASSAGDGPVVGAILETLAQPEDQPGVSPTQFHNSVHNAAAGYWTIATGSRQPATCLGGHDDTWAAGLLSALAEHTVSAAPVLLCCYDHPLPAPLDAVRPLGQPFAAALVLASGLGPTLQITHGPRLAMQSPQLPPPLAALAAVNPAARALPLLAALANERAARLSLPYLGGSLVLDLRP